MARNGNNNNTDDEPSGNDGTSSHDKNKFDKKKLREELDDRWNERLLFERFKNVAVERLNQLSRQAEDGDDGNNSKKNAFTMGEEEQRIIASMNGMGLKEGVCAGLVTFLVLRRGPVYFARWIRRRQHQHQQQVTGGGSPFSSPLRSNNNNGYQLSDPRMTATTTGSGSLPYNPFRRAEYPRSRSFFVRSIWFTFDATLSLMMGASVSMAYTDVDEIRSKIVDMPLVHGRSLTADALCDDVVREWVKMQEENDPTYERLRRLNQRGGAHTTPASSYLEGIVRFCENCQRRRYVERRLRQERGLARGEPVEVPIPGVDRNGPRLVVNMLGEEMVVGDGVDDQDFHQEQFGSHDMEDWADGFVSDRKDQDRKM
jgi:hypothetical protein